MVYDPAKLDVGPETEAILDQLKGREYQVSEKTKITIYWSKGALFASRLALKQK